MTPQTESRSDSQLVMAACRVTRHEVQTINISIQATVSFLHLQGKDFFVQGTASCHDTLKSVGSLLSRLAMAACRDTTRTAFAECKLIVNVFIVNVCHDTLAASGMS